MAVKNKYTLEYFIEKFNNISDSECTTEVICKGGAGEPLKYDCLGHCKDENGKFNRAEQLALLSLAKNPVQCWDGRLPGYSQATPRLRLLKLLNDLKDRS